MSQRIMIGVIGSSAHSEEEIAIAEEVGALVAERGATLVCGGMGGVMEAACRGAQSKGGLTVGILPGDDRHTGNDYLDIVIPTGMGYARNVLVVLSSTGVVAIGGAYGTLSEIAYCRVNQVPVIGIKTWELKENRFPGGLPAVDQPSEAVEVIFQEIGKK
jgi:uncharacterized protein (TIGR00725 family)